MDAVDPAGAQAEPVATLTIVMTVGAVALLALVIVMLGLAAFGSPRWKRRIGSERTVLLLGVGLPVILLSALLIWGLRLTSVLLWPPPADPVRIRVTAKQWWWQVAYLDGARPITANEIVIPAGRPAELDLRSSDVIHSFWVPRLAGKIDMIPGHSNRLVVHATQPGVYLGQCAEYCGGPHALMRMRIIALPPQDYEAWHARQAAPARAPQSELARRGQALFVANACMACHAIRGTPAAGRTGPDLTHIGSRDTIAAGIMPRNVGSIAAWITEAQHLKPQNKMPSFRMNSDDLLALATYLAELE